MSRWLAVVAVMSVTAQAQAQAPAQRRDSDATLSAVDTQLESPVQYGAVTATEELKAESLPASTDPTTPLAIIEAALPHYETSVVAECAERAQKARWETDNIHFDACVCPQVAKWRLPKVTEDLRVRRALSKGRNGYSFTVDKDGRTKNCRVWSGSSAPADDTVAWKPVRNAATTAKKPTISGEKKRP